MLLTVLWEARCGSVTEGTMLKKLSHELPHFISIKCLHSGRAHFIVEEVKAWGASCLFHHSDPVTKTHLTVGLNSDYVCCILLYVCYM